MPATDRYEIIDTIAQGDYAIVYRTRDNELQREVAVKQIHQQYLQDPDKLDQYWKEAQLLASLEHPYITTIYDIDRGRGWLILELMQGSLQQQLAGNPIDLESLRLTLIYMLHALSFLEKNDIVHGDVKPSNLMLDKNNRVKMGDFGIARRMTGDDGSVVKGTTKYMAPEVVSDQFGPVGPHSDLYSLGFSAFELMCGSHFDTLFPGLNMFGRDQQIAWMMWHSALDRRLPEINRVLEGVPEELAYVIQKLTEKDAKKRYRSAEQVLDDLRSTQKGEMPGAAEAAKAEAAAEAAKQQKKKKVMVCAALAVSLCLTLAMAFIPSGKDPVRQQEADNKPTEGIVEGIDLTRSSFAVREPNKNVIKEIKIGEHDRIELNGQRVALVDLRVDDEVKIETVIRKSDGNEIEAVEVIASRPEGVQTDSYVQSFDASSSLITLKPSDDSSPLKIYVPSSVTIWLNNADTIDGRKIRVGDLEVGDHVRLTHVDGDPHRVATSLRAKHVDHFVGKIVEIDPGKRTLTVESSGESAERLGLPLDENCVVTLNSVEKYPNGLVVSLNDLRQGYDVDIVHDTHITRIDAAATFADQGLVQSVDGQVRKIEVRLYEQNRVVTFSLAPETKLMAGSQAMQLSFLRPGDRLTITHKSVTLVDPVADAVSVDPLSDPRAWSVVIGRSKYERLSLKHADADAQKVIEALLVHYRVPAGQSLDLLNKSIDEIRPAVTSQLDEIPADSQLIVYYIGHAFQRDGLPYLAEESTNLYEPEGGLSLKWLIDELDQCAAAEKILLLDICHDVGRRLEAKQPSGEELVSTLSTGPTDPISASVTIIANCSEGERGRVLDDGSSGRFASVVAEAFTGKADADNDRRISADELFSFLETAMAEYLAGGKQTPALFLPNPTPPRLAEETKKAVRTMLGQLAVSRLNADAEVMFASAAALQPSEPDARIAQALVYLAHDLTAKSEPLFEQVAAQYPKRLVPHQALAWQYFMKRRYQAGIDELRALIQASPKEGFGDGRDAYVDHAVEFAGVLRQFALTGPEEKFRLTRSEVNELDQEVLSRGARMKESFSRGVAHANEVAAALQAQIEKKPEGAERNALIRELRRLSGYTGINYDLAADYLRATLDH